MAIVLFLYIAVLSISWFSFLHLPHSYLWLLVLWWIFSIILFILHTNIHLSTWFIDWKCLRLSAVSHRHFCYSKHLAVLEYLLCFFLFKCELLHRINNIRHRILISTQSASSIRPMINDSNVYTTFSHAFNWIVVLTTLLYSVSSDRNTYLN